MKRLLQLRRAFCATPPPKHRYRFDYASSLVPHPQKEYKGGEDALFTSDNVLAVADGVGGWAEKGIDPGLYSKQLMALVGELVNKDKMKYVNDPKALARDAVSLNKETGSTTLCLLTLNPDTGLVKTYYLGDSVFAIFHELQQKARVAKDQQYHFNFPVQVGTEGENPDNGVYYEFDDLNQNHILVAGTDGIWDNLPLYIISEVRLSGHSLQEKADHLTQMAKMFGTMPDYESPFYLKAKQAGIPCPPGGKLDDNAVIVAKVIKEEL